MSNPEIAGSFAERRDLQDGDGQAVEEVLAGERPAAISSVSVRLVAATMRTSTFRGLVAQPRRTTSPS